MKNLLPSASIEAVSADINVYCEAAMQYPLAIERDGQAVVLLMSMEEYKRLAALNHTVTSSADMPDTDAADMHMARVSVESIALNSLMPDC